MVERSIRVECYAFGIALLILMLVLPSGSALVGTSSLTPFSIRGTNVALDSLYYCPNCQRTLSYQPNGWSALQALNVNVIRVSGGTEGDISHFNIERYPNEWATNLDSFLSQADAHGMRVVFAELGTSYGTLFGIVSPQPGIVGTPVGVAKAMIDSLAGANTLRHDFLTDRRIVGWSVANEVDLADLITYHWCIQILDYIREKGGKAYVSSPYDSHINSDWLGMVGFQYIEPLLRGHVDYLEIHIYELGAAADAVHKGLDVYDTLYKLFSNEIQTYMIDGRGSIPIENLIIGEFGIWHGSASMGSFSYNFTEQTRIQYYRAMLQAAADKGIKNVYSFYFFDQSSRVGRIIPAFGIEEIQSGYVAPCALALKQFYE